MPPELTLDDDLTLDELQPLEVREIEKREIWGRVVPYGEQTTIRGRPESFTPGSFANADLSRVRLLLHHDRTAVIGRPVKWEEREDGLYGLFRVSKTERGDEALTLAADGVLGFSPTFLASRQSASGAISEVSDVLEVSLVPFPAYRGAKPLAVRSREGAEMPETEAPAVEPVSLDLEQIEAMQSRQDEIVETLNQIQATLDAPSPGKPKAVRPPSGGEWLRAEILAEDGKFEKREEILDRWQSFLEYAETTPEWQSRELQDVTGGGAGPLHEETGSDMSGVTGLEQFLVSQMVNVVDARQRLFRRLGSFPAVRSGYARIPVVTQHTLVGKRAGQKQNANSRAPKVTTKTFENVWVDSALDVALELIRTAEIGILDFLYRDLLGQVAVKVEADAVSLIDTAEDANGNAYEFTYSGQALDYTGDTAFGTFMDAVEEASLTVEENTDVPVTKLGVNRTLWKKLVAATDKNDRRQFAPGDYSSGTAGVNSRSLRLTNDVEVFYVRNLQASAVAFNEEALRGVMYGLERVEATNVEKMGRDIGVLGRYMLVPRIPSGVYIFGSDESESESESES